MSLFSLSQTEYSIKLRPEPTTPKIARIAVSEPFGIFGIRPDVIISKLNGKVESTIIMDTPMTSTITAIIFSNLWKIWVLRRDRAATRIVIDRRNIENTPGIK